MKNPQKQKSGVMQNKGAGKTMSTDAKFVPAAGTPSGLIMKEKVSQEELTRDVNSVTLRSGRDRQRKSRNEP